MKKYEYKSIDLSPSFGWDNNRKQSELVDRLNELGKDGWILVSGVASSKYSVVMREISGDNSQDK